MYLYINKKEELLYIMYYLLYIIVLFIRIFILYLYEKKVVMYVLV